MNKQQLIAEFRQIYLNLSTALNRLDQLREEVPEEVWDEAADNSPLWAVLLDLEDAKAQADTELGPDCPVSA
jgi:hypothetical protein